MSSEYEPPRLFNTVTSNTIAYNMDTIDYLISQEIDRRSRVGQRPLSTFEQEEFRRQLIRTLIIKGDAEAAINLRSTNTAQLLNG